MKLKILQAEARQRSFKTRMPFRFGVVTISALERISLRLTVEDERGRLETGDSADFMVPRWFSKDPAGTPAGDVTNLAASVHSAAQRALNASPRTASVFAHWNALQAETFEPVQTDPDAALVAGFGVALVERALMDAATRLAQLSFHQALRGDLFGFEPAALIPALEGWELKDSLPAQARQALKVRHTVGFLDVLAAKDVARDAVADGLPRSLEEDLTRHGLCAFKLKLSGQPTPDAERLSAIAKLLLTHVDPQALRISVDANEQYADLGALAETLAQVSASPAGRTLLSRLAFIEQPVPRRLVAAIADDPARERIEKIAPLLLDEGDTHTLAFRDAIGAGWRGVSVKTCKGVFRAFLNRGLVEQSRGRLLLSAEDLTSPALTALVQDLSLAASLDLPDTEKNAHHYFRGLDNCSAAEQACAVRTYPHLFACQEQSVQVRIRNGLLDLTDFAQPGFGGHGLAWDELDQPCFVETAS
jgi:hypothetical protein